MILKKYYYVLGLLACIGNVDNFLLKAAAEQQEPETWTERLARNAQQMVKDNIAKNKKKMEESSLRLKYLEQLGAKEESHSSYAEWQELKRQQGRIERQDDGWHNINMKVANMVVDIHKNFYETEIKKGLIEAERKTEIGKAFASSLAAQEGITARDNKKWAMLSDRKNLALWALVLVSIPVTIYACKLGLDYASSKWGMPTLVKESSRQGLKQSIKNWFTGKKPKKANLDDIVLAPDVDVQAKAIAESTKKKQKYNAPYQNLLLYGSPGTGKTEFAKTLARYSGMDYAIVDGGGFGPFKKGSRGVTEVNNLFDWAEQSKKGLLIFIDEADSFAPDRNTITDADERNILNTFIARTGAPSTKYMIVFATNHRDALDSAVRSRLGKPIHFDLPEIPERVKILKKKIEQHVNNFEIKNDKTKKMIKLSSDPASMDETFLLEMATAMKEFSGRDIEKAVIDMQALVLETDDRMLTQEMVRTTVVSWIAKIAEDKKITEEQKLGKKKG